MANYKKVCDEPGVKAKINELLTGKKAKTKCRRVKVDKNEANSIASKINWGNKHKG